MDQPVTEQNLTGEAPWLADATNPLLAGGSARLEDPNRPDRLAWNTFRTLALWDTDAWVPSLLEVACGAGNALSPLEWGGASVVPWGAGPELSELCDVVLDGPEAYVVVACTLVSHPSEEQLRAAAVAALDGSLHQAREAGLVVVAPPGSDDLVSHIEHAGEIQLHEERTINELLAGAGWVSWPELGRLAADLVEEGQDPSPTDQVRRLLTELAARFPDATV